MKLSSGVVLAGVIVLVLMIFEVWQYFDAKAYRETMNEQLLQLSVRVDGIDERVQLARQELKKMEESSLGGLIENANDALINGWSAMLDTVEKELQRAKEGFDKQGQKQDPGSAPAQQPSNAAPDNTGAGVL
ncbi:hypothetical protein AB4876_17720 [Zhongshania guokunii]|uniref:Uncharacterized protein n=1 Tax=Zhongshania guokunii TaxID=641783 RepID=A0ABV3UA38_9GAMM